MKNILPALLAILLLAGCGNEKAQEKALLDSVIKAHDRVMGYDGTITKERSSLKSLVLAKPALRDSINYYLKTLDASDNKMMDWMNKFNPDFTGKTHGQVMSYLYSQEKEVTRVDSQMKLDVSQAADFLKRNH